MRKRAKMPFVKLYGKSELVYLGLKRRNTSLLPIGFFVAPCKKILYDEAGLDDWLKEQQDRQALLEDLLDNYNEGRSMSLYCKVCARMPIDLIKNAIKEAKEKLADEKVDNSDMKSKARILKTVVKDFASQVNIDLN